MKFTGSIPAEVAAQGGAAVKQWLTDRLAEENAALETERKEHTEIEQLVSFIKGFLTGPGLTPETALPALRRAAQNPAAREQLKDLLAGVPLDTRARFLAGRATRADIAELLKWGFGS